MSDIPHHVHQAVTPGDQHRVSPRVLTLWRFLAPITYLAFVLTSVYHTFVVPQDHAPAKHHYRTIWGQNKHHRSPFALNAIITSVYWIILWILQLPYLFNLFTPASLVHPAVSLAPSFTAHNLLAMAFVALWTREELWWALLVAIINWFNLTFAYFRYPKHPRLMHAAALAGPLAFAFVTLFWDGAAAFGAHNLPARIVANVFVWSWAVYGGFYLVVFKDWAVGGALAVLTAALGVGQFFAGIITLQWIFAFTIMALLFLSSLVVAFPEATGVSFRRGEIVGEDRERAPLLVNEGV